MNVVVAGYSGLSGRNQALDPLNPDRHVGGIGTLAGGITEGARDRG